MTVRDYGRIQCRFWQDRETRALSDAGKAFSAYLMTGPHSNGLGCYYLPDEYLMLDFPKWSSETISERLAELSGNDFAKRCNVESYLFIPKFLKWNPIANGNVAKARQAEFESIPKTVSFYSEIGFAMVSYGNHWADRFKTVLESISKQEQSRTEQNRSSDPNGSEAPFSIWDVARKILGGKLLGNTLKKHGDEKVQDATIATLLKRPADPKSYLLGVLNNGNTGGAGRRSGYETPWDRIQRADDDATAAAARDSQGGDREALDPDG